MLSTQSATSSLNTSPNNNNNNNGAIDDSKNNYFCGPTKARDLFWNFTRVGEINVQPCPGGASGIAKWRCAYVGSSLPNQQLYNGNGIDVGDEESGILAEPYTGSGLNIGYVAWQPLTPDLTQCRSLWLNNLELRANQRDSPIISIANDLSQVSIDFVNRIETARWKWFCKLKNKTRRTPNNWGAFQCAGELINAR